MNYRTAAKGILRNNNKRNDYSHSYNVIFFNKYLE